MASLAAVKRAYPNGHPPELVHKQPANDMRSALLIKGFGVPEIKDKNGDHVVVIEPNIMSEHKAPIVWGILANSKLRWALENKAPITPKMCVPPGATSKAIVLAQKLPVGSRRWMLNTTEPAPAEVTQSFMRQAIETRIRHWGSKQGDSSIFLVNDLDVMMETQSFHFVLTAVATANRLRNPEWGDLADVFLRLELSLLKFRLVTSFAHDLLRLYRIAKPTHTLISEIPHIELLNMFEDDKEWIATRYSVKERILALPFEHCLDLLGKRDVVLHKGIVFVPESRLVSTIRDFTRTRIRKCLAIGIQDSKRKGKVGPWADERCRELIALVKTALQHFKPGGSTPLPRDVLVKSAAEYEAFMKTRAPPCMQQMHDRHVPNKGRLLFINFTSRMGIPRKFVLEKWRKPFQAHWGQRNDFKSLEGEFEWAEKKGAKKRVSCNHIVQCGHCPFVTKAANALPLEARNACSRHQQLQGDASFALFPVLRVKSHVKIELVA